MSTGKRKSSCEMNRLLISETFCSELFQDVAIRVKSTYSEKGGELIRGVKFIWSPQFNKDTLDYDIALLKVNIRMIF